MHVTYTKVLYNLQGYRYSVKHQQLSGTIRQVVALILRRAGEKTIQLISGGLT